MKKKIRKVPKLTLHHRKPTSIGGSIYGKRNHSFLPIAQHEAWHTIFSNLEAHTICALINEKYLDPDYKFICVKANQVNRVKKLIKKPT
jgi:hypothetical protein